MKKFITMLLALIMLVSVLGTGVIAGAATPTQIVIQPVIAENSMLGVADVPTMKFRLSYYEDAAKTTLKESYYYDVNIADGLAVEVSSSFYCDVAPVIENAVRDTYIFSSWNDNPQAIMVAPGESEDIFVNLRYSREPVSIPFAVVDENGDPVVGAEFLLAEVVDGKERNSETRSSDENGEGAFVLFEGGDFVIRQMSAPSGYVMPALKAEFTIGFDGGTCVINAGSSPVNAVNPHAVLNGNLTVSNVVRSNRDEATYVEASSYSYVLSVEGKADQSFSLAPGGSQSFLVPIGASYTVTQVRDGANWNVNHESFSGKLENANEVKHEFVNTYKYADPQNAVATIRKVSSADPKKTLSGAEYTLFKDPHCHHPVQGKDANGKIVDAIYTTDEDGIFKMEFSGAGTFYLKETDPPAGFAANDSVYPVEVVEVFTKTRIINEIVIQPVFQALVDGKGSKNGIFDIGDDPSKKVDIVVNVEWKNDSASTRPSSVTVILYQDGKENERRTVYASEGWTTTFAGRAGGYNWTVEEVRPTVYYAKKVTKSGNTFTVTNTYSTTPITGDENDPFLWALALTVTAAGAALTIRQIRRRKNSAA